MPTLSTLNFADANECVEVPFAGTFTCTGTYEEPKGGSVGVEAQRVEQWRRAFRLVLYIEPSRYKYALGPLIAIIAQRVRLNTWWPALELPEGDPITLTPGEKPTIEFYLSPTVFGEFRMILRELVDQLSKAATEAALAANDPQAIAESASREQVDAASAAV